MTTEKKENETQKKGGFKHLLPQTFLKKQLNKEINITTKNDKLYRGTLQGYDNHMNLIIQKNGENILIRGDIIKTIRKTPKKSMMENNA